MNKLKILISLIVCHSAFLSADFLDWDNQHSASIDKVLDDPLIVIRSKVTGPDTPYCIDQSIRLYAHIARDYPFEAPVCKNNSVENREDANINSSLLPPEVTVIDNGFYINDNQFTKIQWQVASDSSFDSVYANLQGVEDAEHALALPEILLTHFNAGQTYFARVRGLHENSWSPWSSATSFQHTKPEAVNTVDFEFTEDHCYRIFWKSNPEPNTQYLVYASHSLDFVPDIYGECETATPPITITTENAALIDSSFPYCRVIACQNGNYSVPSPIVNLWREGFNPERNIIKEEGESGSVVRKSFGGVQEKKAYSYNPTCPYEDWLALQPYFIPENHPIKTVLDRIFSTHRVVASEKAMAKAGFINPKERAATSVIVTTHPRLRGVIVKTYTDSSPYPDWIYWKTRITGAETVRHSINLNNTNKYFKVPKKWVYPLPLNPAPTGPYPKVFILLAQDMGILSKSGNEYHWKNCITPSILDGLYVLLVKHNMIDSIRITNIPFCHDGKIAFVDTEWVDTPESIGVVRLWKLYEHLSSSMEAYWRNLAERGPLSYKVNE